MAEFPALPIFTDAYLADTRHLTAIQHGAYLLLLMMAWRTPDCSLPNDDEILAKWAAMDKKSWRRHRNVILSFWRLEGNRLVQGRLKDERQYVEHLRMRNSASGKASALKRLNRGSTTVQPNVNQTSTPIPTPIPIPIESNPPVSPLAGGKHRGERLEIFLAREFPGLSGCPLEWGQAAFEVAQSYRPGSKLEFDKLIDWHYSKFSDHFSASSKANARKIDWRKAWLNWWKTEFEKLAKQEERDEIFKKTRNAR